MPGPEADQGTRRGRLTTGPGTLRPAPAAGADLNGPACGVRTYLWAKAARPGDAARAMAHYAAAARMSAASHRPARPASNPKLTRAPTATVRLPSAIWVQWNG